VLGKEVGRLVVAVADGEPADRARRVEFEHDEFAETLAVACFHPCRLVVAVNEIARSVGVALGRSKRGACAQSRIARAAAIFIGSVWRREIGGSGRGRYEPLLGRCRSRCRRGGGGRGLGSLGRLELACQGGRRGRRLALRRLTVRVPEKCADQSAEKHGDSKKRGSDPSARACGRGGPMCTVGWDAPVPLFPSEQMRQAVDLGAVTGEGVDPLRARNEQLERGRRLYILDADGKDRFPLADRTLDLARNERRLVARFREDEDEAARLLDTADDLVAVTLAGPYVARRDPAFEAPLLQRGRNLLRALLVGSGMADKGDKALSVAGLPFRKGRLLVHAPIVLTSHLTASIAGAW